MTTVSVGIFATDMHPSIPGHANVRTLPMLWTATWTTTVGVWSVRATPRGITIRGPQIGIRIARRDPALVIRLLKALDAI